MNETQKAVLAAGCFWGVESRFRAVPGVADARVGYTGGRSDNPTYREVCGGKTGHAEAIEITFDPEAVSYRQLLEVFWTMHDPHPERPPRSGCGLAIPLGDFLLRRRAKSAGGRISCRGARAFFAPDRDRSGRSRRFLAGGGLSSALSGKAAGILIRRIGRR